VPFAAIADGRQKLPDGYWREFLRWPYAAVTVFTLGAYVCHPLMQRASYSLHW
jgi:zeta-carotene isomerase